jgi:hypothetical protein
MSCLWCAAHSIDHAVFPQTRSRESVEVGGTGKSDAYRHQLVHPNPKANALHYA